MLPENIALEERLSKYNFYHCIRLNPEVITKGYEEFVPQQMAVLGALEQLPVAGKRLLDIGCRDGLISLRAEQLGAAEVVGIDNDLSKGATEVVLPYLKSKVRMYEVNLYDLTEETFGKFDVVVFPGVLYHLRYPIWGLKRIRDVLKPQGWLLIETAVFLGHPELPLLFCPIDEESPYEPSSVSFFNVKGLTDTLSSLGIRVQSVNLLGSEYRGVDRGTFLCRFIPETVHPNQAAYWENTHKLHTEYGPEETRRIHTEKSDVEYRKPSDK
jgi:SAM-dependent methyltransferase